MLPSDICIPATSGEDWEMSSRFHSKLALNILCSGQHSKQNDCEKSLLGGEDQLPTLTASFKGQTPPNHIRNAPVGRRPEEVSV